MLPAVDALCQTVDLMQLERHEKLLYAQSIATKASREESGVKPMKALHQFSERSSEVQRLEEALRAVKERAQNGTCRTRVQTLTSWAS